ncbi:MAG: PGF-pre-PGF domain-containing protein [Candidatus Pacearchaeota archaeon]
MAKKEKSIEIIFFTILFIVSFLLLSNASASLEQKQCEMMGEVRGQFYCNSTFDLVMQKPDGHPCQNDFECINGSCLEGLCSVSLKKEIIARRGLLEKILSALQGQAPVGFKEINSTSPTIFTAAEIGAPATSSISFIKIVAKKKTIARINYDETENLKDIGITKSPPGIVYKYISLSTYKDISSDIESVEIYIKIPKSWFIEKKADKERVRVYRWYENWIELAVSKEQETDTHVSYKVNSPGFSFFAITAFAAQVTTDTTPISPPTATCSDGIQNQGETGVDCGGPCNECPAVCGNNIIEKGENCESCPLDIKCSEGEICKNKRCIKKPFPFWTVFFIVVIVAVIGFVAFKKINAISIARKKEIERVASAINYVINASKLGEKEENIRQNLLKAGWSQRQVDMAFKEAKKVKQ